MKPPFWRFWISDCAPVIFRISTRISRLGSALPFGWVCGVASTGRPELHEARGMSFVKVAVLNFVVVMGVLLCVNAVLAGPVSWDGRKSESHGGYDKYDFKFAGKSAWVVVPKKAAPGNPWVWRGRWATFHSGPDRVLLAEGFHIAYFDTGGMLGCDRALDLWDKFYDFMTKRHGLAKKPVLEAVSRGGLFVFRWASRHPDRVSCVYADSPVCDIKSWPLGKWKGDHDDTGMRQLGEYYGFDTEDKILAFKGNPVDTAIITPIAKARIPVLFLVSGTDRIAPPGENAMVFAERYKKLGGPVEFMFVPDGAETALKGHHFAHPDPKKAAAFMKKYGMPKGK